MDFIQLMLDAHNLETDGTADETADEHKNWKDAGKRGSFLIILILFYYVLALSNMEIVLNALLFFLAGYETTSTAMSFVFYNLALNEHAQQILFDEIENALEDNNV